jgi:type II secretory pathway pseudopilin PulG
MQYPSGGKGWSRLSCQSFIDRMAGFTFIGLMIIIAIMGVVLLTVGEVWHTAQKRAKEQELLFAGNQFRQAIKSYKAHTPATNRLQIYPMNLEDLLKDPRYPTTQRYLRKIYLDPFTGKADWGITRVQNGGIIGVYSLSEETAIKISNFKKSDIDFEGKTKYADWVFMPASAPVAASSVVAH